MQKQVTIGQFIGTLVTVIGTAIWFYINTNVRLALLEKKQEWMETSYSTFGQKLDAMTATLNAIKVELHDKADRYSVLPKSK